MSYFLTSIPLLHVGGPEPGGPTYSHWQLDPRIMAFVFAVTGLYLAWVGPLNRRRPGHEQRPVTRSQIRWFLLGSVFLTISLGPPIDDWSHYFFASVHMVQHLILMFVVVPCWLKGIPAWVYDPIVERPRLRWMLHWLPRVMPAFFLSTLIMGLWHIPELYNATMTNDLLHAAQHGFFLVAGFFFFWPLMSPVKASPPLPPPAQCLYLFLQTIPAGLVGALITFAGPGLYPHYLEASARPLGIDIAMDQEIAGLLMWVGMNAVFLGLISVIFLRWGSRAASEDRKKARQRPPRPVMQAEARDYVPTAQDVN